MDKYEYNIKAEQIVKLIKKKDYVTAAKIADGIDWRRVRNLNMLLNVGTVYEAVCRYQDAKEILLLAFDRAPLGRRLAYKLAEVCIESEDFREAEAFFKEFVEIAPRDTGKYELLYKMAKKKGEPLEHLIQILEEYKAHDFEEAWAYELACLYHQVRWAEKCVSECDEIILWFGEGEYVEKAMELKMLYTPLSQSQQEKYYKRYQPRVEYAPPIREEPRYESREETVPAALTPELDLEQEPNIPREPVSVSIDMYSTLNLQEALAESMESLLAGEIDYEKEQQESAVRPEEIFEATRDIRKEPIIPKWNSMQAGLDDEDAMDLNDQIEGQMTIEEVLALYSEKEEAAAARVTGEIILPKEIQEEGELPVLNIETEQLPVPDMETGEILPISEISGEKELPIPEVPEEKELPISEISGEKELPILEISGEKELPIPEVPEEKELLIPEVPEEKELPISEISGEKELPISEISGKKKLPIPEMQGEIESARKIPEEKNPVLDQHAAGMETANLKKAIDQVVEEVLESIQEDAKIESGKAGTAILSEENRRLFKDFLHMEGLEEQLAEIFAEAGRKKEQREDSLFGNIVIIGEHKTGKTTLAVDLMKALNRLQGRKGRKIAKISGDRLNRKGIADTIMRLIGADLLIESAGEMDNSIIKDLLKAMTGETGGMRIILEDTPGNIKRLLKENPDIEVRFANTIVLEECNIAQWVEAARRYAAILDYAIDDMATLALSAKLDAVLAEKNRVEEEDMKTIMDIAISKAEKKNIKKLLDVVFSRKYKDSDLTILREVDFE